MAWIATSSAQVWEIITQTATRAARGWPLALALVSLQCTSELGDLTTASQSSPDGGELDSDGVKSGSEGTDPEPDKATDSRADAGAVLDSTGAADAGSPGDASTPDATGGSSNTMGSGGANAGGTLNASGDIGGNGGSDEGGAANLGTGGTGGETNSTSGGTGGSSIVETGGSGGEPTTLDAGPSDPPEPGPLLLVSSSPAAGDTDVDTATHIQLTFDRDLAALTGDFSLRRSVDDTSFETLSLTASQVSILGATLTVDLDGILAGDTPYYVTLDADAVEASDGGSFGGVDKSTNISFSTAAVTYPGGVVNGLTVWLDANLDASLKLNLADVTSWGDRSGNNNSVKSPASGTEPDRIATVINGHPVIRFDGINDELHGPVLPTFSQYDIFVVWQSSVAPRTDNYSHLLANGSNFEMNHGHPDVNFRYAGASDFSTRWGPVHFLEPAINTPYVWNLSYSASTDTLSSYTNGTATNSLAGLTQGPKPTTQQFTVGNRIYLTRYFAGDIAEVVIYDRPLDNTERANVESYLESKWGL